MFHCVSHRQEFYFYQVAWEKEKRRGQLVGRQYWSGHLYFPGHQAGEAFKQPLYKEQTYTNHSVEFPVKKWAMTLQTPHLIGTCRVVRALFLGETKDKLNQTNMKNVHDLKSVPIELDIAFFQQNTFHSILMPTSVFFSSLQPEHANARCNCWQV